MVNTILKFKISGITCDACIRLITLKVKRIGIQNIDIDRSTGEATIQTEIPLMIEKIAEALKDTPYNVAIAA